MGGSVGYLAQVRMVRRGCGISARGKKSNWILSVVKVCIMVCHSVFVNWVFVYIERAKVSRIE